MDRASGGLVAAADAPSAHVSTHVLLTYFQTGWLTLATDGLLVAAVVVYFLAARSLGRGRHWPRWQIVAFGVAALLVFVAVGSGLAAYDGINLSAHVVQHLFLMMLAPPLFALARPVTLAAQSSSRGLQRRLLRVANSRTLAILTSPPSWALYYGSMWVYFVTGLYAYANTHEAVHEASHVVLFAIGYLFWQGVVGLDVGRHRTSHAIRLWALFLGMPLEAFLALTIMSMDHPIAPGYTVAGTHAGGAVFWITSMLVMAIAIIVALRQWIHSEERHAARIDAALDAPDAAESVWTSGQIEEMTRVMAPQRPDLSAPRRSRHG